MALSSKALQQKRAKKSAKRKLAKKSVSSLQTAKATEWLLAASDPIADVFVPVGLFDTGMGTVWFSRHLSGGGYALSAFMLDTFCLGVKNALYTVLEEEQYDAHLDSFLLHSGEEFVEADPAHARKLVESAVIYAERLGFKAHADYKTAKIIFGDVEASSCDAQFTFGRDGQPLYIPGPYDSVSEQRRILKQLEKLNKDPFGLLTGDFGT